MSAKTCFGATRAFSLPLRLFQNDRINVNTLSLRRTLNVTLLYVFVRYISLSPINYSSIRSSQFFLFVFKYLFKYYCVNLVIFFSPFTTWIPSAFSIDLLETMKSLSLPSFFSLSLRLLCLTILAPVRRHRPRTLSRTAPFSIARAILHHDGNPTNITRMPPF